MVWEPGIFFGVKPVIMVGGFFQVAGRFAEVVSAGLKSACRRHWKGRKAVVAPAAASACFWAGGYSPALPAPAGFRELPL